MDNPSINFNSSSRSFEFSRRVKQLLSASFDLALLTLSLWAAYALRFTELWPEDWLLDGSVLFILSPIMGITVFYFLDLYRIIIQYVNLRMATTVIKGLFIVSIAVYVLIEIFNLTVPRSIPIIFSLNSFLLIFGYRLLIHNYYHWRIKKVKTYRVLIYGAGSAGNELLSSLLNNKDMQVVGFLDDNQKLAKTSIAGVMIYSTKSISEIIKKLSVDTILVAIPNSTREQRRVIVKRLSQHQVHVLTVPSITEILNGVAVDNIRELDIEDLLGRDPIEPLPDLMAKSLKNKSVCITGAGGSIGSELARQCVKEGVKKLVLLDNSEFALYAIEKELNESEDSQTEIIPVLGSVTNMQLILKTFIAHKIETIYHAAAYKHVPMVESNPISGIYNNAWGTKIAADAAVKAGVERFILISTDKAVRPTNVMGATKRVSELALQALASKPNIKTLFSMVRFGNVLGSSGSVVPLFRQQIASGGPVKVTHKDITRFFMTISEAASLVIQAGSMATGGEVFLLHMGKPIRIFELAEMMIKLSGYNIKSELHPDGDIEILITGLRPGEKLYEELLVDNQSQETEHKKIFCAQESFISPKQMKIVFQRIQKSIQQDDVEMLKEILTETVSGYKPNKT